MTVRLVVPLPQIQVRITSMPGYLSEDKVRRTNFRTNFTKHKERRLNPPVVLHDWRLNWRNLW